MFEDINCFLDYYTITYWPKYIEGDSLDFICFLLWDEI